MAEQMEFRGRVATSLSFPTRFSIFLILRTFIFNRAAARMSFPEFTDNCLVNIMRIGRHIFGISETNLVREIDPETLESMDRVKIYTS